MKHSFLAAAFVLLFIGGSGAQTAYGETSAVATTQSDIKVLLEKIAALQKQLSELTKQVQTMLKDNLTEGSSDDDIRKIQELLATDPNIYPEGKITGYFGPLTKEALKRFQKRYGLKEDGALDAETRKIIEKYLKENKQLPKSTIRTGVMELKDAKGNQLSCAKDAASGKITCSLPKKQADTAPKKDLQSGDYKNAAKDALAKAKRTLAKAENMIEESDRTTNNAEAYADQSKAKLAKAEDRYGNREYVEAKGYALESTRLAEKAMLSLK